MLPKENIDGDFDIGIVCPLIPSMVWRSGGDVEEKVRGDQSVLSDTQTFNDVGLGGHDSRLLDFDETVPGFPLPTVDDRTFMSHMKDALIGKEFIEADVSNGIVVDEIEETISISFSFIDGF